MIFRMLQIVVALCVALGGGAWLTWYTLRGGDSFDAVTIGGWTAYPDAGTPAANPYAKARLARDGSLSIGAAEGVTFFSDKDVEGNALTGSCQYEMRGTSPSARLWTLVVARPNQLPVALEQSDWPASVHSQSVLYLDDGSFSLSIAAAPKPDNWLSVPAGERFILAFTLYDSPVATNKGLIETPFPIVKKVGCDA
jgi:hypothetical protein